MARVVVSQPTAAGGFSVLDIKSKVCSFVGCLEGGGRFFF